MTTTAPLVGYVASLRDEIRTARIAHAETTRLAIASRLHDILALVQPTDAIDHAIGALCDRCFDLLEVLKQCDSPGPDDVNAVTIVRSAALIAVDDLEQVGVVAELDRGGLELPVALTEYVATSELSAYASAHAFSRYAPTVGPRITSASPIQAPSGISRQS